MEPWSQEIDCEAIGECSAVVWRNSANFVWRNSCVEKQLCGEQLCGETVVWRNSAKRTVVWRNSAKIRAS